MYKLMKRTAAFLVLAALLTVFSGCSSKNTSDGKEIKRILLRGDLHVHTKYSWDGKFSLEEVAKYSKQSGYDFIVLSDHNTTVQNHDPYTDNDLIMIPGMEWTNSLGHAQVIGIPDPLKKFALVLPKDIAQYFADVRKQGAMVQINHSLAPDWPWKIKFDDMEYDCVELFHGGWNEEEEKVMMWWQERLKAGKKVVVTAGSDSHTNTVDRFPFNCVYSASKSQKDILDAIKEGHLYLSVSAKGPDIELKSGDAIMGDSVSYQKKGKIDVTITNLKSGDDVEVLSDTGSELKEKATSDTFSKEFLMEKRMFYRVEVRRSGKVVSLSNPIYIKNK